MSNTVVTDQSRAERARLGIRLTLVQRMVLVAQLPALVLTLVLGVGVKDAIAQRAVSQQAERWIGLVVSSADLLKCLQRERGATSVYLSSNGDTFGPELEGFRSDTDAAALEWENAYLRATEDSATPLAVTDAAGSIEQAVASLTDERAQTDSLDTAIPDRIRFYTALNAQLLALSGATTEPISRAGQIGGDVASNLALMTAQERMGLIRAQVANVMTNHGFGEGQRELIAALLSDHDSSLTLAIETSRGDVNAAERGLQETDLSQQVHTIIADAFAAADSADPALNLDPTEWFGIATDYIDLMVDVEAGNSLALTDEAHAAVVGANRQVALMASAVIGTVIVMAVLLTLLSRAVRRPLSAGVAAAQRLATGDMTTRFPSDGHDEIADLGRAMNTALDALHGTLERVVTDARSVAAAAELLSGSATRIAQDADFTSSQVREASEASTRMGQEVQSVAAATEQVNASIAEIARSTARASDVSDSAQGLSEQTSVTMSQLGESSGEIGEVIRWITTIAEQTNLLALNATIEAARAGEAGKGFAVVAQEVKALAQSTSTATADIGQKVEDIQRQTTDAVDAMNKINTVIDEMHLFQASIAGAAEEQSATTNMVSQAVQNSALEAHKIDTTMASVAEAMAHTSNELADAQRAALELAQMGHGLNDAVSQFTL